MSELKPVNRTHLRQINVLGTRLSIQKRVLYDVLLETDPKQNFAVQFRGGDLTSETADVYQQSRHWIDTCCKLKWSHEPLQ